MMTTDDLTAEQWSRDAATYAGHNTATVSYENGKLVVEVPRPLFYMRKLLQFDRPRYHPWLSVELVEQEIARQNYEADKIQLAEDSLA